MFLVVLRVCRRLVPNKQHDQDKGVTVIGELRQALLQLKPESPSMFAGQVLHKRCIAMSAGGNPIKAAERPKW